jgi:hypothetical protein
LFGNDFMHEKSSTLPCIGASKYTLHKDKTPQSGKKLTLQKTRKP